MFLCVCVLLQTFLNHMKADANGAAPSAQGAAAGPSSKAPNSNNSSLPPLPEWPPAGSLGMSPGLRGLMGTSLFGKSVDMVDVCTDLMGTHGHGEFALVS